jgi:hypothetical protein
MQHLYNTIRPVGNRAIVAIKKGSKNSHLVTKEDGTEVELFIDTSYSWDGRVSGQTQAILLTDFKNLKAGTDVLIHHNAIDESNQLDIYIDTTTFIHAIESSFIYFGVNDDGLICIDGYMIVERVYDEDMVSPGGIILTEKKKQDSLMKIVAKPDSIEDFEVGDIAVVYKKSDYEMTHNVGGKMTKVIRLKYSDCLGKA